MPILNSVYYGKKLFASEFFCPNCLVVRPYAIRPMSKEMTFFTIPLLETNETDHVIVCQGCKKGFDPEVLKRNIQSLFKLVGAAKGQLDQGISPGYLKLKLMSDGLKEVVVDQLITLAQH